MYAVKVSAKLLQNVLDYLHEEQKDYINNDEPYNHIYRDILYLQGRINDRENEEDY